MKRKPLWKRRRWSVARLVALLVGSGKGTSLEVLQKRYGITSRDLMALHWRLLEASGDGNPLLVLENSVSAPKGPKAKAGLTDELSQMATLDISETLWAVRALAASYGGSKYDKVLKSIAAELTKGKWKGDYERFGKFYSHLSPPLLLPQGRVVLDALQEQRLLRFKYEGSEPENRVVKPLSFRRDGYQWRLLAWDNLRDDWRVFKLNHMRDVKAGDGTFEWPKDLALAKMKNMDLGVYRSSGGEKQVRIKIRQPAWDRFRDLFPLSRPPAKGWVTLSIPSSSPEWVARHFLPGLGDVQIIGPKDFRDAWLEEVKAVQKLYR